MKRNIIILLIAACVGITLYINKIKEGQKLDPVSKSQVEALVLADARFPARPVWWEDDSVLAVGVMKKQDDHSQDAKDICELIRSVGIKALLIEIYDLGPIQQKNDWQRIGVSRCDQPD